MTDTCPTWSTLLAWLEDDLPDEGGLASQAGRGISRLRYSVPDLDTLRELVLQRLVLPSDWYCQVNDATNGFGRAAAWSRVASGGDYLAPGAKGATTKQPVVARSQPVPAQVEEIPNRTVHRQKSLRVSSGLEPAHLPLSLSGRLMRDLCSVVRIARGDMLD